MRTIKQEDMGMVYVFSGDGKGKTSAALGMMLRTVCLRRRVIWVSWYKSESWPISEKKFPRLLQKKLSSLVEMYFAGEGFFLHGKKRLPVGRARVHDLVSKEEHLDAAHAALDLARVKLRTRPSLLILDELVTAVEDKLISVDEVLEILSERGKTHLVLTGRGKTNYLNEEADLISQVKKLKHPFDKGVLAKAGLDF